MGGLHSDCAQSRSKCYHAGSPESHVVRVAPPDLTAKQKQILEVAWEKLERDIADVGVITFVGMFKTHPQVQDFFMPFTGLAKTDEQYSTTLRQHALRVMATMEKCIHRLDEPDRMKNVLESLGGRHGNYNGKVEYVDLLGSQFVKAVKENTPDWNDDLENAWLSLVRIVCFYLKKGWMEKQRQQATREATRREYMGKKPKGSLSFASRGSKTSSNGLRTPDSFSDVAFKTDSDVSSKTSMESNCKKDCKTTGAKARAGSIL